ncbi:MAG: hypothetical protein ABS81_04120 [Pseudonocardia sp. SCN 72-86]|nr:MAG: hypothetical protein ABS81_04120 [Pseudonocardia sp. SCN 72-86]
MSSRSVPVSVVVNGVRCDQDTPVRLTAADFIRDRLGLTGTHLGCEQGVCGACTVLIDGRSTRSCTVLAVQLDGAEVRTVESLDDRGRLHPVQEAFRARGALQCGFCTPGMLMTSVEMVEAQVTLTEHEVRRRLAGNICRCTGYQNIVDALLDCLGAGDEPAGERS